MFLLDANVILEFLLDQEKADDVGAFLRKTPFEELGISDFALHSIGIILFRERKFDVLREAFDDFFVRGESRLLSLAYEDIDEVARAGQEFNLDFDDAYQYACAEKYDLTIVSFDSDFDRTPRGRKTPAELLK